jgi:hypothetical protein
MNTSVKNSESLGKRSFAAATTAALAAAAVLMFASCDKDDDVSSVTKNDYAQFAGKTVEIVGDMQLWDFGNMHGNGSYVYQLVFTLLDNGAEGVLKAGIDCAGKSDMLTAGNSFAYTFDKSKTANTLNILTLVMPDRTGFDIEMLDKASVAVNISHSSNGGSTLIFDVSIEATASDRSKFTARYKGAAGAYSY